MPTSAADISGVVFAPWPSFTDEEVAAVSAVLRSGKVNYWTGQEGRLFEQEFAAYVGTRHAIALSNGSVSLEIALKAMGIGAGDEVVVSPRSFIASVSCVALAGATPVFADVDRRSGNITAETIERVLTPRTKAVIPVHLAGWPCDMDPIMQLAGKQGLRVLEDCAQAHGARYKGRSVGSIGDIGSWSFCQDKILTTGGEGGMLTTNDEDLWSKCWSLKDHGKSYDAVYNRDHPIGFRWLHESFGTNARLTEMQSAIGRIALRRLPETLHARNENARRLGERFEGIDALRSEHPPEDVVHSYYKYYVYLRPEYLAEGWSRDRVMQSIAAEGVPCFSGSCSEIYRELAFAQMNRREEHRLPVAKELGETSLMFLVHPTLSTQAIDRTCDVVESVLGQAARH